MSNFYHLGADSSLAPDHPVRAISLATERVDLTGLFVPPDIANQKGAYALLLVQLIAYGRWVGLEDSPALAQACEEQLPFVWLSGQHKPNALVLNRFLAANMPHLAQTLAQIFSVAGQNLESSEIASDLYQILARDAEILPLYQGQTAPQTFAPLPTLPAQPALPTLPSLPAQPSLAPQAAAVTPLQQATTPAPSVATPVAPLRVPALGSKDPRVQPERPKTDFKAPPRMGPAKGLLITLVRKEILSHLRSLRFLVSAGLCLFMMVVSSFVLLDNYATRKKSFDDNNAGYRESASRENSYYLLEFKGINIERPPSTLQAFYAGLEKNPDRRARMWSFLNPQYQGDVEVDPTPNMFPMVDYLFVVGVVMSLLAFIFSYDAVTGEREGGTLKLLLSYSLPRDVVILGKWIGGYIALIIPFLIGVLVSVILALSKGATLAITPEDWMSFGMALLMSLAYIAAMFSVGLFVSVTVLRSSTAISVLLFIWVIFVLVVPNASPYVADQVQKITSVSEWQARRNQALGDIVSEVTQEFKTFFEKNKNNLSKLQEFANGMLTKIRERTNATDEEQEMTYRRELDAQVKIAQYISLVSPLAAYTYAATEVADTGIGRDQHLRSYVYTYQDEYKNWIENKINSATKEGVANSFGFKEQKFDLSDMPTFQYKPRSLSDRINQAMIPLGILLGFIVVFFMASYISFLKKDII